MTLRFMATAAGAALTLLSAAAPAGAEQPSLDTYRQLKLFGDVLERVRVDYVDEVTDEELIKEAIRGMLTSLDPHSSYLDRDELKDVQEQTRGEFGGLGIQVTMQDGLVQVIAPIDDTPAARAGLQSGDLIAGIEGETVQGLTLNQAVDRLKGKVGTEVTITVLRGDEEPFDVTLVRAIITVASVRHRIEGRIGYIRITQFNDQSTEGLEEAIEEIEEELGDTLIGYVLDLRNNPGGLLDQAISVTDAFLEQGEIVSTRGRNSDDMTRYNARPGDLTGGKPIVVLINDGSASASEIVSGALKDHRRAILMGTRSFGKGSVQTIVPLPGHGAMRLTTARYYTPSGVSIQATGIEPDIEVALATIEPLDVGELRHEEDLRGSLENPQEEEADETPAAADGGEVSDDSKPEEPADGSSEPTEDYQLSRALDLLRGLALFDERAGVVEN
ncbi:MAG: S41 family peptidase [Rhodospirillales bacterium]|nr:S41 family peptidase [Rhodospirillales bacterium]